MKPWLSAMALTGLVLLAGPASADWFADHVEIHGFLTSQFYARSPSFDFERNDVQMSSWRNELNIETDIRLYEDDSWDVNFFGVFRPVYDAVYEINPNIWGDNTRGGAFDPLTLGATAAPLAVQGRQFPGHGACVVGEFCLGNSDVGSLFSSKLEPALIIDDKLFFGSTTAPWNARGGHQGIIGGNATGLTYVQYAASPLRINSATQRLTQVLSNLPAMYPDPAAAARAFVASGNDALLASFSKASLPITAPLNARRGALGDVPSLTQAPFDVNRTEPVLKTECTDNAHPWCFVRDFFFQVDHEDTSVRLGRQQIVWGKTDAFRLQDLVNPVDSGYHNVFPDLEERRIPMLALDVLQSFGKVGPLLDMSLEFAWVFDRFIPSQFGQCGEPYAFTIACQGRADAAAHQLFNIALAKVEKVPWTLENSEPGARLEFRLPEPSISFSFSFFYGRQDLPLGEFQNLYSVNNPNPAAMLFLQGQGLGPLIETLAGAPVGSTPWSTGFDPYDTRRGSELRAANDVLLSAWRSAFNTQGPSSGGCAGLGGFLLAYCADQLAALSLPWTASEAVLKYPRVLTLGASADYQIPNSDAIFRFETAYDFGRGINNTTKPDGVDKSDVFLAAVGIDRPTYIPFLNPDRTALISAQTFIEHVVSYDPGTRSRDGMVLPETQFISTFLMENYWRNDSLILRNFIAYDWNARAFIFGPSFRWVINNNLSAQFGLSLLLGDADRSHNIRDLCPAGGVACIGNPGSWNPGQWQTLNRYLVPETQPPWWARQGFADRFMSRRDEFWAALRYQF